MTEPQSQPGMHGQYIKLLDISTCPTHYFMKMAMLTTLHIASQDLVSAHRNV